VDSRSVYLGSWEKVNRKRIENVRECHLEGVMKVWEMGVVFPICASDVGALEGAELEVRST
jgi:hypothetical protein